MDYSIMTFNLRVDIPSDNGNIWKYRADKVAAMIAKHNPVIIGIQEGLSYMLTDIADRLPAYKWIGQGRDGGEKGEFSAILYHQDILSVSDQGQFWLSEKPEVAGSKSWGTDFPRICTWGHFQFVKFPGKEFFFYNTHLDHVSQEAREKGIRLIWDFMCSLDAKTIPAFLAGDFNANPDNNVIKFLQSKDILVNAYSILQGEVGLTFHSFSGGTSGEPIDYIFSSKEVQLLNITVDRSKVYGGFPSDHYPVILTVSI
ncbi:endonuclease/exonuclease/phosphatase family protein [Bacillus sp. T33-2]|uniref:endonuclease/exonuclease/phosphatase family protein n=1 Tax=Bacillus sp. T33-2 TaxID=2054168 RepID=UPI000C7808D1|nr:endonuclease/exonuclease/phosphatase family protein [Bacillus sp. T33-2]PLR99065.1 endonuclease [Bacillus sp. T33-2]